MRGAVGLVERVRGGAKRGDRSNSTRGPRVEDSPRQSRGASAPSFIVSDIDPRGGDEENSHGTSSHPHGELGTLSPADRAEHQKGTKRARLVLVGMTVFLILVALTRPIYGPYIDRFGERGDESVIQAAITQLNSNLEIRAKRNNLVLPKPWGHRAKQLTHDQKHAAHMRRHREYAERLERERAHWVKAIAALKEATPEERDRIIKTLGEHDRDGGRWRDHERSGRHGERHGGDALAEHMLRGSGGGHGGHRGDGEHRDREHGLGGHGSHHEHQDHHDRERERERDRERHEEKERRRREREEMERELDEDTRRRK